MMGSGLVEAYHCNGRKETMCSSFPMIFNIMEIEKGEPIGSKALLSLLSQKSRKKG
jgi:hypothetical protein